MPQSAHRLVERLSERFERSEVAFHEAYWESQIEASESNDRRRAELELEVSRIKGDATALEEVNQALSEPIHDDRLRRQLEVLRMSLTANQMSEEERERIVGLSGAVESDFATHRPEVDGKRLNDNEIEDVLTDSDDVELRKRAWYASKEIGGIVVDRVVELVRVRNEVARNLGFADYYRMELDLQEIEEGWLFDLMDELEALTTQPFSEWKDQLDDRLRGRFGTSELFPWHYADPFFQNLPPDGRITLDDVLGGASAEDLALKTFDPWGIDLRSVMSKSDLYPRENKCQHAFCIDIDRLGDVRMLCNVVPGERWVEIMLHESGHAAFDVSIDSNLPYLLRRPSHIFVTEAAAIMSGRLVHDRDWLLQIARLDRDHVESVSDDLRRAIATQSLQFARWGLVMVHFERSLYSDPEGDLDTLWWDLVERFQLLRRPAEAPAGAWAAKIHLAAAPVYYQNYLLGEILASQLRASVEEACGGFIGKPAAGEMIIERMFRPGNLLRWNEITESATGKPLSANDYALAISTK